VNLITTNGCFSDETVAMYLKLETLLTQAVQKDCQEKSAEVENKKVEHLSAR